MKNISVVLVGTRFPENVGMVARACANFNVHSIILVAPEWWDIEKARPLATAQGAALLEAVTVVDTVAEALAACTVSFAMTSRSGGWRKELFYPHSCVEYVQENYCMEQDRVALVFGSEKNGLSNEHLQLCSHLVTIPTSAEGTSLNLAQAVLLMLYEFFKLQQPLSKQMHKQKVCQTSAYVSQQKMHLFFQKFEEFLVQIDKIQPDNNAYFMLAFQTFFNRKGLRRHEFDMFMGIVRQCQRKIKE